MAEVESALNSNNFVTTSDIWQLKRSRGRDVATGSSSQRSDILSVLVLYNIFNSCAVLCSFSPWELPGWGSREAVAYRSNTITLL